MFELWREGAFCLAFMERDGLSVVEAMKDQAARVGLKGKGCKKLNLRDYCAFNTVFEV